LVVGVTRDAYVNKPGRPVIPEDERVEMVNALDCVNAAWLCNDSLDALRQWQPKIFVKGHDYVSKGLLTEELKHCSENNILVQFTQPNPQTTSGIIQKICASQLRAA